MDRQCVLYDFFCLFSFCLLWYRRPHLINSRGNFDIRRVTRVIALAFESTSSQQFEEESKTQGDRSTSFTKRKEEKTFPHFNSHRVFYFIFFPLFSLPLFFLFFFFFSWSSSFTSSPFFVKGFGLLGGTDEQRSVLFHYR